MYFEYGLSTCIPYKLIDRGHVQHTSNSVVKEPALTQIDSISDQFELLVSAHLHAGKHVVQPLNLVDTGV